MDIVDGCCLARQLRGVEIVDLVRASVVEQVEDIEPEPRLVGKLVADPQIDERRRFRGYAVAFDQRPPPKVTEAQRAKSRVEILDGRGRGGDHVGGARDVVAGMAGLGIGRPVVAIGEAGVRGGEIAVET